MMPHIVTGMSGFFNRLIKRVVLLLLHIQNCVFLRELVIVIKAFCHYVKQSVKKQKQTEHRTTDYNISLHNSSCMQNVWIPRYYKYVYGDKNSG